MANRMNPLEMNEQQTLLPKTHPTCYRLTSRFKALRPAVLITLVVLSALTITTKDTSLSNRRESYSLSATTITPPGQKSRKGIGPVRGLRNRVMNFLHINREPKKTDTNSKNLKNHASNSLSTEPPKILSGAVSPRKRNRGPAGKPFGNQRDGSKSASPSPKLKRRRVLLGHGKKTPRISPPGNAAGQGSSAVDLSRREELDSSVVGPRLRMKRGRSRSGSKSSGAKTGLKGATISVSTSQGTTPAPALHVKFNSLSGGESVEESVWHFDQSRHPRFIRKAKPEITRKVPVSREDRRVPYSDYINSSPYLADTDYPEEAGDEDMPDDEDFYTLPADGNAT